MGGNLREHSGSQDTAGVCVRQVGRKSRCEGCSEAAAGDKEGPLPPGPLEKHTGRAGAICLPRLPPPEGAPQGCSHVLYTSRERLGVGKVH